MQKSVNPSRSHTVRQPRTAVEMALLEPRRLLAAATVHDVLSLRTDDAVRIHDHADLWQPLDRLTRPSRDARSHLKIDAFDPFALDEADLRATLAHAPMEFTPAAAKPVEISLPTPDGTAARFAIVETMVMDPKLAAKFTDIKTYRGQGIDDPTATVRLDYTPEGFHAQVIAPGRTFYVDPYWHRSTSAYASYWRADVEVSPELIKLRANPRAHDHGPNGHGADGDGAGEHEVGGHEKESDQAEEELLPLATFGGTSAAIAARSSGTQLRTYRTAVAATGEYTSFHGGTVAAGQAAIVTAINRVTGIYESELAVRLQLIANNDTLVFTNASSDPYTNNDGGVMLTQNQSRLDSQIGSANYDIGHVFSTGGGGIAYLGVVGINGYKAGGVTGLPTPVGDAFYVDYVAHEMGHQFGANHTFNTSTDPNRHATAAYEPGGGSTIMSYAGITGDNLQSNSDPYFSFHSFDEIIRHVDNVIPGVGMRTNTGNAVPTVNAGADFTIPASTPFALTGSAADGNGDVLSYSWEQRDLGPATQLESADNGSSPLFRVYNPTTSPTRVFPRLESILSGANSTAAPSGGLAERLPTLSRTMDFRLTARDNRSGGGGVNVDDMIVNVVNTGAAFSVTSFNASTTLAAGSNQTITWNVAGTTGSGINAANVNIRLSTDGGLTFPTLLAANTPNDGTHLVTLPALGTTRARLKIEPTNNIFFDISNANFTIVNSSGPLAPTIGSLIGSPNPVAPGAPLSLTANSVADGNADPVTVTFYRESNGSPGLQTGDGGDSIVGSDGTDPYAINLTAPATGTYTYYAQAIDPGSLLSNVVSTNVSVNLGDTDDQIAEAVPFSFGSTVNGAINPAGDVDIYAITVAAGQTVSIDVDLPGSLLDSYLRLFNGSGTQLAFNDDNASGPSPESNNLESYLQHTFAAAGTYYIGISAYQNSAYNPVTGNGDDTATTTGTYTLTITTSTPTPDGSIAGKAFHDYDHDFNRDAGEPALPGTIVYIDANNNSIFDSGEMSRTSNANGDYAFTELADGEYRLRYIPPTGYHSVGAAQVFISDGWDWTNQDFGAVASVYNGTSGDDNYLLRRSADGLKAEVDVNGVHIYTVFYGMIPSLSFNLSGGNDSLTLDYVNGNPMHGNGVVYNGGAGANSAAALLRATGESVSVNGNSFLSDGTGLTHFSVGTFTIDARGGADTVSVTPAVNTTFRILGGDPTTTPGDALILMPGSATGLTHGASPLAGYEKRLSFADRMPIDYGGFESTSGFDATPPAVTNIFVAGSNWTQSFRDFLQSSGQGDANHGYRLTDAQHADELMWINLNKVSVRFSEDVNLAPGALRLFGVNVPEYAGSVAYDSTTFTATFTLASGVFAADKLLVHLDDARITDVTGNGLDGEWTNPAETTPITPGGADAYPSGNGTPGGDFGMRLNVLPGDVTRDGQIVGNDVTSVRGNQGFLPGQGGYTIFRDVTGDGRILGNDVTAVRSRQGIRLPLGAPSVPSSPRPVLRRSPFTTSASSSIAVRKLGRMYDLLNDEHDKPLVV